MSQPIKIRGRFATVRDTAEALGVSESRVRGLIDVLKRHTRDDPDSVSRYHRRANRTGIVVAAKKKADSKHAEFAIPKSKANGSKTAR
jgi:hypothetical protein